ncbi:V-type ATP synthase subunit I, partial [Klebsiella oxytoca]
AADTAAELYELSADKQQNYCLLICHRADEAAAMEVLRPHAFSVVSFQGLTGTAAENLQTLERQLEENRTEQAQAAEAIAAQGSE